MNEITAEFAKQFAEEWVRDWNSHNLEKILRHYTDDFVMESPLAATLLPHTNGKVVGKDNVRAYWAQGLQRNPALEFELLDVLHGVGYVTLYYRNKSTAKRVVEVLHFNDAGLVDRAMSNYSK